MIFPRISIFPSRTPLSSNKFSRFLIRASRLVVTASSSFSRFIILLLRNNRSLIRKYSHCADSSKTIPTAPKITTIHVVFIESNPGIKLARLPINEEKPCGLCGFDSIIAPSMPPSGGFLCIPQKRGAFFLITGQVRLDQLLS